MIKLSIIIVSFNTQKLLEDCLKSILNKYGGFDQKNAEIIIVDNGSDDGSVEMVQNVKRKTQNVDIKLIENKENLGFSKGNNLGIKEAKGKYIMLLNSDTIVKESAIEKLVNFLDKNDQVAIVGPALLNSDGSYQENCGSFPTLGVSAIMLFKEHYGGSKKVRWVPEKSDYVDWLTGAAFVARKQVFEKIGGLDEKIFMYMEEVEWFYRAKKAGFRAYCLKEANIMHLGRGSSVSGKTEPILNIYKGLIYFYKKHRSMPELIILKLMLWTKAVLAILLGVLKNDVYLKETYGKALKIA